MNLNITRDEWNTERHSGPVFPGAEERSFEYQNEGGIYCQMSLEVHGYPPRRVDGKKNRDLPNPNYSSYELVISRFTGKTITVKLVGHRSDILEQRRREGFAVTEDVLERTISFGELINRIFADGCQVFHETEAFPDSVKRVMRSAYPRKHDTDCTDV